MTRSALVPSRRLPEQPNLEQLRKQAKNLLTDYRSGEPGAIEEVQTYERIPDPTTFSLHDAQRVLARAYGFPSWPKLKAFVDGVNVERFMAAVQAGDLAQVRSMLASRPELIGMDVSGSNEHRAIHYAVLRRDLPMTQLLMEAGADARKGIYPHRDATTAYALAHDRGYADIVEIIEEEERRRREEMSCINATVSARQDQISAAISRGDTEKAVRLLEEDLSQIHACDRDGGTPLHAAARTCNLDLLRWLLDRRASVRKPDANGWTALDLAALAADPRNERAKHFPEIAELLLQNGARLTPPAAVALGQETAVRNFVNEKPELLREIGRSGGLLTLAVKHSQLEVVRLLLDLGAEVNERVLLEELKAPTETWGMPLWYAALAGNYEICKLLLDRGADPNANVYASGWPLRNAWDHERVRKLLLERNARIQPYMIPEIGDLQAAKNLIEGGASEEEIHEVVWSAADHGCPEILAYALPYLRWPPNDPRWNWVLIQPIRGASSNPGENDGYFAVMEILLRRGINPDIARFGQTQLNFLAARQGLDGQDRVRFAALLLDHGASLTARDELLKSTPLGWACRWGRVELASYLLSRGARVDEIDAEPWATPLAWARKMHHAAIVELLERA